MGSVQRKEMLPEEKKIAVVTVICKIINIFNQKMNALQKITGLRLRQGGCSKRVINEFNKTFDSVSYPTILSILDKYSKDADVDIAKWQHEDVIHVGDNVDVRKSARHELGGVSHHDIHMYNNMLYKARINTSSLSDVPPALPSHAEEVDLTQFIPNAEEQLQLIARLSSLVGKTWGFISALSSQVEHLNSLPQSKYSAEMAQKSEKVMNELFI